MRKTIFRTLAILLIALLSISVVNAGVDTSPSGPNLMQRVSNLETLVVQQDEKIKELQETIAIQDEQIANLQSQVDDLAAVHIPTIEGNINDLMLH